MAKRVLVADDERSITDLFALILGHSGYQVERAFDGAEALDLAHRIQPDAVLLDNKMPRMKGTDVARRLRANPSFGNRPVLLISSADESDINWREAGADMYLQKPVDIRELPRLVDRLIEARTG